MTLSDVVSKQNTPQGPPLTCVSGPIFENKNHFFRGFFVPVIRINLKTNYSGLNKCELSVIRI
jgi:hypothetical protein